VPHIVGKLLTRAITLLKTSFQLEVCKRSYGFPKLWESSIREFQDSNFGILDQNDIWVLAPWPSKENTISGKVVTSPKFESRWSCEFMFTHGLFVHQKCSNYALTNLLFGLCRSVWVIDLLITLPNPHPRVTFLPPKCYEPRRALQLLFLWLFSTLESQLNPLRSPRVR